MSKYMKYATKKDTIGGRLYVSEDLNVYCDDIRIGNILTGDDCDRFSCDKNRWEFVWTSSNNEGSVHHGAARCYRSNPLREINGYIRYLLSSNYVPTYCRGDKELGNLDQLPSGHPAKIQWSDNIEGKRPHIDIWKWMRENEC